MNIFGEGNERERSEIDRVLGWVIGSVEMRENRGERSFGMKILFFILVLVFLRSWLGDLVREFW